MTVNDNLHYNGTIRADWWNYYEGIYFITMTVKNRIHAFGEIHRNSQTGQNNMNFSKLGQFVNDEIPKIMDHYPYVFLPSWVVMPDHVHFIIMIDVRGKTWKDGISNDAVSNDALSNDALSNDALSNDALSNDALSNDALSNDALSNDALSNDALSNDALSNDGILNQYKINQCRRVSRHAPTMDNDIIPSMDNIQPMNNGHTVDNIPNEKSKYMSAIAPKCGSLGLIIGRFKGAVTKYANDNHIPFQWQSRFYDSIIFDQAGFERVRRYINNNVTNWKSS